MWNISLNGVYKKRKIRKKLEQIPLEEEIKKEIERIVEEMNYDDAIPERIYDPAEEERIIREGEIARTKRLARRKIIFAEKRNTAKQMLNDNISVEKISKYWLA